MESLVLPFCRCMKSMRGPEIAATSTLQTLRPEWANEDCMLIYRFLSGVDDSAFCHKVTKALSEGWELHGSASYAYDAATKTMKAGQAVTRIVADQPYDPDKKLVDYR
jgi:hypothetical protein